MQSTVRYAEANLPTANGAFRVIVYRSGQEEHVAMVRGDVAEKKGVLVRIHSECFTSETLGSLRCDCRRQLDLAFERIAEEECGVLIHLRQEGRGIGLGNKIRAYALQDQGVDTVEANLALGFAADLRHYDVAIAILRDLNVASIRLMTNNPLKIDEVTRSGIVVDAHESHWVDAGEHDLEYVAAKKIKMGHIVPNEEAEPL